MRITESGYKTHYRQEVDWKYSVSARIIYTRINHAIVRITGSGYETHCRKEVDWKYSVSAQILYIHKSIVKITESGYETHHRQEVISHCSNLIHTRK